MEDTDIDITSYLSVFGVIHVAMTEKGIFSLDFHGSRQGFISGLISRFLVSGDFIREDHPRFSKLFSFFESYFAGKETHFDIDLDLRGTPFQLALWRELSKVPFGSVISYGELAKRAGSPRGARAAGRACGANPVPLIVPCHRVLTSTGKIGGYSAGLNTKALGGVELKRALLRIESIDI